MDDLGGKTHYFQKHPNEGLLEQNHIISPKESFLVGYFGELMGKIPHIQVKDLANS